MIKSVIAGAVAMAVVSFGANAAVSIPQGQGEVSFKGTVVNAPCGIETQSAKQEIDFGQISKSFLQEGGETQPKDLNIKLVNCDITNFKKNPAGAGGAAKAGTVTLTFSGVGIGNNHDMLQTVGGTNTAIIVTDPNGKPVKFDGTTPTGVSTLVDGDNTIHFTALVKKDPSGNAVKEGVFSAVTNFNLTYQ